MRAVVLRGQILNCVPQIARRSGIRVLDSTDVVNARAPELQAFGRAATRHEKCLRAAGMVATVHAVKLFTSAKVATICRQIRHALENRRKKSRRRNGRRLDGRSWRIHLVMLAF
jgi:hypothetical protein